MFGPIQLQNSTIIAKKMKNLSEEMSVFYRTPIPLRKGIVKGSLSGIQAADDVTRFLKTCTMCFPLYYYLYWQLRHLLLNGIVMIHTATRFPQIYFTLSKLPYVYSRSVSHWIQLRNTLDTSGPVKWDLHDFIPGSFWFKIRY